MTDCRGPLAVLNVATFFTTFGLLNAARFAVPLCGPSHANLAVLLEMPDLLLKVRTYVGVFLR